MASTQESSSQQAFHWHYSQLDDHNFQIGGRTLFFVILLLAIIVTLTLLFLYARLLCRSTNLLPISDPHAPPLVVSKLPITLHLSSAGETECCICLGIIGEGEKVKVLPECSHCYHSDCLDRWLFTQASCPLCRVPLVGVVD